MSDGSRWPGQAVISLSTSGAGEHTGRVTVRPPAVAGSFYPGQPSELTRTVGQLLDEARSSVEPAAGSPKALLLPHAGYVYSGPTAALGYALLERARSTVRRVNNVPCCMRCLQGDARIGLRQKGSHEVLGGRQKGSSATCLPMLPSANRQPWGAAVRSAFPTTIARLSQPRG